MLKNHKIRTVVLLSALSSVSAHAGEYSGFRLELESLSLPESGSAFGKAKIKPQISVIDSKGGVSYREIKIPVLGSDKAFVQAGDGDRVSLPSPARVALPASIRKDGAIFFQVDVEAAWGGKPLQAAVFSISAAELNASAPTRIERSVQVGRKSAVLSFLVTPMAGTAADVASQGAGADHARPDSPLAQQACADALATERAEYVRETSELIEESTFYVTLKFKKREFSLDYKTQLQNEAAAKYETIVVGEKTYNEWKNGQTLDSSFDWIGAFSKNGFASYDTRVSSKKIEKSYHRVDRAGKVSDIKAEDFKGLQAEVMALSPSRIIESYSNGMSRMLVLDRDLSEVRIVSSKELTRYYIKIKVQNNTFTLDLNKQLRNATLSQEIELEVPASAYNNSSNAWSGLAGAIQSRIFTGHFSALTGTITKRWTEQDPAYVEVTTDKGETLVVSKAQLEAFAK